MDMKIGYECFDVSQITDLESHLNVGHIRSEKSSFAAVSEGSWLTWSWYINAALDQDSLNKWESRNKWGEKRWIYSCIMSNISAGLTIYQAQCHEASTLSLVFISVAKPVCSLVHKLCSKVFFSSDNNLLLSANVKRVVICSTQCLRNLRHSGIQYTSILFQVMWVKTVASVYGITNTDLLFGVSLENWDARILETKPIFSLTWAAVWVSELIHCLEQ